MANATLAVLQTQPRFGATEANLDALEAAFDGLEADLVVLPELFATGYSFRDRAETASLAEPFGDGPTAERLSAWSAGTGGIVVAGYVERDGDRLYNAAAIHAGGRPLASYRKAHLFGFERECFDPGDSGFLVVEHAGLRVGTMVCFDWMFPEAARSLALQGADVIAHPSNLVLPGWCQRAMEIRALENGVYTATANRFGTEAREGRPSLTFTGLSQLTSTRGKVLARAPQEGPGTLLVTVDVEEARRKGIPSGNDILRDRRPDLYTTLTNPPKRPTA